MGQNGRLLAMLLIGVFFGTGLGFLLAAPMPGAHDHESHDHAVVHDRMTEAADPVPSLALSLTRDADGGANLHLRTENFRFAPEAAGGPHRPGEGHAHIYVDGEKIARAYGPWFHIVEVSDHAQSLTVTLHANDHSALALAGKPIAATADLGELN